MDTSNFSKQTKIKTNPISPNSIQKFVDKKSKIVVAHSKGIYFLDIQSFDSTLQIQNPQNSGSITCLTVSDQLVFFAGGMHIMALALNGKIIFDYQTFLAEQIDKIHVHGYHLWIICGNLLNQVQIGGLQLANKQSRLATNTIQKTENITQHVFNSKINDSALADRQTSKPYIIALLNNNEIHCFSKKSLCFIKTQSPPTSICELNSLNSQNNYLVGTMNGQILCIQPSKTKINILWTITNKSLGKINCIVPIKNGFLLAKDKSIEFWNNDRQLIGSEQLNQKITSCVYIDESQTILAGTKQGSVMVMCNYEKALKMRNQAREHKNKQQLQKDIDKLNTQKQKLKKQMIYSGKAHIAIESVTVNHSLTLDYVNYCYTLEITSNKNIKKIIFRTKGQLIKQSSIYFQGKDSAKFNNYVIRIDNQKSVQYLLKSQEGFTHSSDCKLNILVYTESDSKMLIHAVDLDLKPLSLHQKIKADHSSFSASELNVLRIAGQFKYFDANIWLNGIFNDFGSSEGDAETYSYAAYESIVTKTKLSLKYRTGELQIISEAISPLLVIKKVIIQKSTEKDISLSYQCTPNKQALANQINKVLPQLKRLQQTQKKYNLLPGLIELKDQIVSEELKKVLQNSEEITQQYKKCLRKHEQFIKKMSQMYTGFRLLSNQPINQYQLQNFKLKLAKSDITSNLLVNYIVI